MLGSAYEARDILLGSFFVVDNEWWGRQKQVKNEGSVGSTYLFRKSLAIASPGCSFLPRVRSVHFLRLPNH